VAYHDDICVLADGPGRVRYRLPFAAEELSAEAMLITPPPRRCMAVSKERRVLVLGSKNSVARTLPFNKDRASFFFSSFSKSEAIFRIVSISFFETDSRAEYLLP